VARCHGVSSFFVVCRGPKVGILSFGGPADHEKRWSAPRLQTLGHGVKASFIDHLSILVVSMRTIAILSILSAAAAAQPLQHAIRARIGDFPGTVTLYAKNLNTGSTIGIHESDPVRTASTIKLPIL